jgi:hypothetical protein
MKVAKAAAADGFALVGRTVEKEFDGETFSGRVTSFEPAVEWYRVVYSDGDEEEVDIDVLKGILV